MFTKITYGLTTVNNMVPKKEELELTHVITEIENRGSLTPKKNKVYIKKLLISTTTDDGKYGDH